MFTGQINYITSLLLKYVYILANSIDYDEMRVLWHLFSGPIHDMPEKNVDWAVELQHKQKTISQISL